MQCEWDDASAINTEPEAYVDGALVVWDEFGSISEGITFADDLGTGSHEFIVKVADVHGNTAQLAFNLDITGPELEVFFVGEPTISGSQTVNFQVQGGDANSRAYVSLKLNGVDVDISQSSSSTNLAVPLMLSPGEHEFEITVSDQFNTVTRILSAQVACQSGTYWNDEAMACETLPTDPCEASPSILRLIDASPIYYVQLTSDLGSSEVDISMNGEPLGNHGTLAMESNQLVFDFSDTALPNGSLNVTISMAGVECSVTSYDLQFSGKNDGTTTNDGVQPATDDDEGGMGFWFWILLIGLILGMLVLGAFVLSRGESVDPT